jgi:hypothetical protein
MLRLRQRKIGKRAVEEHEDHKESFPSVGKSCLSTLTWFHRSASAVAGLVI